MATILAYLISFSMAFLLFVVQPMATKIILPQFGGTPAVWNTAMLCFQLLLLLGYLYAHVLTRYLKPKAQILTHAALVMMACTLLPIAFSTPDVDAISNAPIHSLIMQLLCAVGLPFFCVSATAPLLQRWVSYSHTALATKPYVLYSASNLGSMSALIGYIVLVEPNAPVSTQLVSWGYLFIAVSLMFIGFSYRIIPSPIGGGLGWGHKDTLVQPHNAPLPASPLRVEEMFLWILLAFIPSGLSLGVTTHITTDIASVPFFWVIPFAIYLMSFVDAFATRPIVLPIARVLAPIVGVFCLFVMASNFMVKHTEVMLIHLVSFALLAFAIHGALAEKKPAVAQLTWYYLCLSIGGALGGVFNAIIAPMLLNSIFEYPLTLFIAAIVSFMLWRERTTRFQLKEEVRFVVQTLLAILAFSALMYGCYHLIHEGETIPEMDTGKWVVIGSFSALIWLAMRRQYRTVFYAAALIFIMALTLSRVGSESLLKERNFYGVSRVFERDGVRYLQHNTTIHGLQSQFTDTRLNATSYYAPLEEILAHSHHQPLGAIGLGIGTVKCQAASHQQVDIFEINPLVIRIAQDKNLFTYLSDCPATHRIIIGDGRLTMAAMPDKSYGAIVLDAFSSDAIPVHLLTRQAFEMYFAKLKPGGILAIHVTNRHLDLRPLLALQADAAGAVAYSKFFEGKDALTYGSFWVVMAREERDLAPLITASKGWWKLTPKPDTKPWTDDYTNILPYLEKMR